MLQTKSLSHQKTTECVFQPSLPTVMQSDCWRTGARALKMSINSALGSTITSYQDGARTLDLPSLHREHGNLPKNAGFLQQSIAHLRPNKSAMGVGFMIEEPNSLWRIESIYRQVSTSSSTTDAQHDIHCFYCLGIAEMAMLAPLTNQIVAIACH